MLHIVAVQTGIRDPAAIITACQRLNLPAPVGGVAKLYSGGAEDLLVRLYRWRYATVADTPTGWVRPHNFENRRGDQRRLDRLLQFYAVELARSAARRKGPGRRAGPQGGPVKVQIFRFG
jgi:hypothetical protein